MGPAFWRYRACRYQIYRRLYRRKQRYMVGRIRWLWTDYK